MSDTVIVALITSGGLVISGLLAVFIPRFFSNRDKRRGKKSEELAAIAAVDEKLDAHIKIDDERYAIQCRCRILNFSDEILHGTRHSQQSFQQIMLDIKAYDAYCAAHPDFQNSLTVHAASVIQETYATCFREKSFL